MTAAESRRFTVQERIPAGSSSTTRFLSKGVTGYTTSTDAQAKADAKNQLDALGIKAGDTVTGTLTMNTPYPGRITITVDREPWTSGTRSVVLSDERSVEAVRLEGLEVVHADGIGSRLAQMLDWQRQQTASIALLHKSLAACTDGLRTTQTIAGLALPQLRLDYTAQLSRGIASHVPKLPTVTEWTRKLAE